MSENVPFAAPTRVGAKEYMALSQKKFPKDMLESLIHKHLIIVFDYERM